MVELSSQEGDDDKDRIDTQVGDTVYYLFTYVAYSRIYISILTNPVYENILEGFSNLTYLFSAAAAEVKENNNNHVTMKSRITF